MTAAQAARVSLPVSPFAGMSICAAAGLAVAHGAASPGFEDDRWDFSGVAGLPVQMRPCERRLDFTRITSPAWRMVAKEYVVALLIPAHPAVVALSRARRTAPSIRTVVNLANELSKLMDWLDGHGITTLAQLTGLHCEAYLSHRSHAAGPGQNPVRQLSRTSRCLAAQALIDLADYSELFTADRCAPGWRPWPGKTAATVGGPKSRGENRTPPVPAETFAPLLSAALYVTGTLGPHTAALASRFRQRTRHVAGMPKPRYLDPGAITAVLARHAGGGIPFDQAWGRDIARRIASGWDPGDQLLRVNLTAIAQEAGYAEFPGAEMHTFGAAIGDAVAVAGTAPPWARNAVPVARTTSGEQVPWTVPMFAHDVRNLIHTVRTAALIVIAALSGMRASELVELRAGCPQPAEEFGPGLHRYRLASTVVKNQPLGGTPDQWAVIQDAWHAAQIAASLLDDATDGKDLLFGNIAFQTRYPAFRRWVNGRAGQRLGLAPIPDGTVNLRMLRRTLAVELAYRPGGLLAAKIALKHISVATTEGYAARPGGAQARFLTEIHAEEQQRNLALTAAEYDNYRNGIMPSGPGAKDLAGLFASIDRELASNQETTPNIVASDQHVRALLARKAGTLHLAAANYCWFTDPSRALCLKLAGTPASKQPLTGMCDSARCPQATHHSCHRDIWADTAKNTKTFLAALPRSQKAERDRLQAELDRAERIVAAIDAAQQEGHPSGPAQ